jgi:hypothetical protein
LFYIVYWLIKFYGIVLADLKRNPDYEGTYKLLACTSCRNPVSDDDSEEEVYNPNDCV